MLSWVERAWKTYTTTANATHSQVVTLAPLIILWGWTLQVVRREPGAPAAAARVPTRSIRAQGQRHRTGFPYAGSRTSTSVAYYFCTEESRAACRAVVGLAQDQHDFATGAVSALSTAAEETARAPHGSMNRLSGCLRKSRGNTEPSPGFYAASVTKACLLSRQPGRSIF